MKVKLAAMVTALVCLSAFCTFSITSPVATAAKPNLCETECGGSWGAREHARAFAEQHGLTSIEIEGCTLNSEYGAQWVCWGNGWEGDNRWEFHVWMGQFGVEKHWTWDYIKG